MAPTLQSNPINTKKSVSFAENHDASVIDSSNDGEEVGDHAPDVLRDDAFLGLPAAQGLVRLSLASRFFLSRANRPHLHLRLFATVQP